MKHFEALQRFVSEGDEEERCDLCAARLGSSHAHVVDILDRRLCCSCHPCSVLFRSPGAGSRFRTVPRRVVKDPTFVIPTESWDRLEVPVRLAFIFKNSSIGKWVSVYPSPGGPTEVVLEVPRLDDALGESVLFSEVTPDIEAILVHGERGASSLSCLIAPIDQCYELVSIVRRHWKGFDGGDAKEKIAAFWSALETHAKVLGEARK